MSKATYTREPSPVKKKQLAKLIDLLQQYKNIGITRVENISSKTIQRLRHDLRHEALLKVAKNTIMRLALEELSKKEKGLKKLLKYIQGSCAFILTNGNPFKVANYLEKKKIPTAAKEGQIAPNDILITARDTGFAPGPVIGELQSIGLKTRIEGGTVKIIEDAVVCKTGEKVSRTLANVLNRLGVEPFAAGLSVDAMYENGVIIEHDELIVDFDEILNNLTQAYRDAYGLALEIAFPTKETISELVAKARRQALLLAIESNFITPETAGTILAKTQLEAIILAKQLATKDPTLLPQEITAQVQTTPQTAPSKPSSPSAKEEEEEEEDSGMGSLFG